SWDRRISFCSLVVKIHQIRGIIISIVFDIRTRAEIRSNQQMNELKSIADHLEILRETAPLNPDMTPETAAELEESLALAEAALRRASAELLFSDE
ncbi:MAG: hypothetical protein AAF331_11460, partial [Pseudomonadota bacterium]